MSINNKKNNKKELLPRKITIKRIMAFSKALKKNKTPNDK